MHHERRLHKLMLADDLRQYEAATGRDTAASAPSAPGALSSVPSVGSHGLDELLPVDEGLSVAELAADPTDVRSASAPCRCVP